MLVKGASMLVFFPLCFGRMADLCISYHVVIVRIWDIYAIWYFEVCQGCHVLCSPLEHPRYEASIMSIFLLI